jgi:MFS family permease
LRRRRLQSSSLLTYSIGVGIGIGLSYVPSVGAVQRWFVTNRVLATGIAVSGIGAGNLVGPLLAAWWIGLFGWRGAYFALAALTLALALPAAIAVENRRLRPTHAQGSTPLPGATLGAALRSQQFWLLYVVAFLICMAFSCRWCTSRLTRMIAASATRRA